MSNITINRIIGNGSGGGKNILLTFDENYLYQTGNLILSLNKYNEGLFYYLFCDKVTKQMEEYLFSICKNIKIYEFSMGLDINSNIWPSLTVMRLFAPFIIEDDINQILYLDSDILCKDNIDDLFNPLPKNYVIAMAPDLYGLNIDGKSRIFYDTYTSALYCNAGVVSINLTEYRKNYNMDEIYDCFCKMLDKLDFFDQDFLNCYFYGKIYLINKGYDYMPNEYKGIKDYKPTLKKAKLMHFIVKPWNWRSPFYIKRLYIKFSLDKTIIKKVKKERIKGLFLNPVRKLKRKIFN